MLISLLVKLFVPVFAALLQAGEVGAAQLPKVAAAFVKFLEDAALFYRRLVMQLQAVYGDVGVKLDVPREAMGAVAGRTAGVTNGSVGMHSSTVGTVNMSLCLVKAPR